MKMRPALMCTLLAAACLALGGCVVTSVYPFYRAEDVVFEPALLGTWDQKDEADERWTFEREGPKGYRITQSTKDQQVVYRGTLFKLKGTLFVDLVTATAPKGDGPAPVPTHYLSRVDRLTPTPKFSDLNYEWLEKLVQQDPKAIRQIALAPEAASESARIVLTADTAELQQFVLRHLKAEGAWRETVELEKRKRPAAQ